MTDQQFTVQHQPESSRYVLLDGDSVIGEETYVDIERDGTIQRVLYHTGVSEEYGGRGLASQLVQFVVDDLVEAGHTIVPVCPYVVKWIEERPEYQAHSIKATPDHLSAIPR